MSEKSLTKSINLNVTWSKTAKFPEFNKQDGHHDLT